MKQNPYNNLNRHQQNLNEINSKKILSYLLPAMAFAVGVILGFKVLREIRPKNNSSDEQEKGIAEN